MCRAHSDPAAHCLAVPTFLLWLQVGGATAVTSTPPQFARRTARVEGRRAHFDIAGVSLCCLSSTALQVGGATAVASTPAWAARRTAPVEGCPTLSADERCFVVLDR